ncbi:hypothetical protein NGA_0497510, partial [Nannochloropsis gaditana CCMP526]|uniref:uncharacterized protein n=1 Tax=Nannochloropsis gaditana (strain CCMP526) TaxID=1093141 RepID=UPI00029F79C3
MGQNLIASITHVNVGDVVAIIVLLAFFWLDYAQDWFTYNKDWIHQLAPEKSKGLLIASNSGRKSEELSQKPRTESDVEEIHIKVLLLRLRRPQPTEAGQRARLGAEDADERKSPHYLRFFPLPPKEVVPSTASRHEGSGTGSGSLGRERWRPRRLRIEVWEEEEGEEGGSRLPAYLADIDGVIVRASKASIAALPCTVARLRERVPAAALSLPPSDPPCPPPRPWMILFHQPQGSADDRETGREEETGPEIGEESASTLAAACGVTRVLLPSPPSSSFSSTSSFLPLSSSRSPSPPSLSSAFHMMISDV